MAVQQWLGAAPNTAQVETDTFANAWVIGDKITLTIGSKAVSYSILSATIATFLASLQTFLAGLSSTVYPEFAEITFGNTATTITCTAVTAGKPFTVAWTTNSASGTITPAATTASSGNADWSTVANWTSAVPITGDTVILDKEGGVIKYGLSQAAVTLTLMRCIAKSFTLGLPVTNSDATPYLEYRPTSLAIGVTTFYLNSSSTGRFKVNFGTVQTNCTVDATGNGVEQNVPAALFLGTHASNAYVFNSGSIGLGFFASAASTALTMNIGPGATVTIGNGASPATVSNYGGTLICYAPISTALNHPSLGRANSTILGTGAVAQLTMQGGVCQYDSTGALGGNTVLGGSAALTFDGDLRTKTVTNPISVYSSQAKVSDTNGVISGGYTLKAIDCLPGAIGLKPNAQLVISYL